MTTTPPDPLATRHDGTPDPDDQAPVDAQTQRLRDENRALRELLAAQVQASLPRPGPLKRLAWWLISAPGAALVGWRSLVNREDATPITGKRVGYATLTVLYTLAIYGALVLLVVSWSTPNAGHSDVSAAGPVRVPLTPPPGANPGPARAPAPVQGDADAAQATDPAANPPSAPADAPARSAPLPGLPDVSGPAESEPAANPPPAAADTNAAPGADTVNDAGTASATPSDDAAATAMPKPTLRITEIPAENPHAWVDNLKTELARCATLGFFERPDCAWAARRQYCGPNQGWGAIKECPSQP